MRIPLEVTPECMKNHDESRSKVFGDIHFEKHSGDNTGNGMEKTVQEGAIFEKEITKIFVNSKNTVSVLNINQFEGHTGSAFHGILVTAGGAETTVTTERDKFKLSAVGK